MLCWYQVLSGNQPGRRFLNILVISVMGSFLLNAVSREPVGEQTSDGGLVGSEGGYRIRRGCYFLPLGL